MATPGALAALDESGHTAQEFLARHQRGEWGELAAEDHAANDQAVVRGERVLSCYITRGGVKLWVITEADRSATTFLLPGEY